MTSRLDQLDPDEAKRIGDSLGVDWDRVDLEQFRIGLQVEREHGTSDRETNVTDDVPRLTGKIALAHLREFPDYDTRLAQLEAEAETYRVKRTGKSLRADKVGSLRQGGPTTWQALP